MKITILTLFPEMFKGFLNESILGRAQKNGLVEIELINLRNWGQGKHKSVDDTPYGGGAGMVLRVDVIASAIRDINDKCQISNNKKNPKHKNQNPKVLLMTPQGEVFNQGKAQGLAGSGDDLILVCGHYEGFDERIRDYVDEEISIGDYVLTGGELAAAVVTDAVVRLVPGVLGDDESAHDETFSIKNEELKINNYLEYPQYTRPDDFEGKKVPEILKSGHHAEIEKWRGKEAKKRTIIRRPDLLK